jgi:erythromycin esterase-like protein
MWRNTDVENFVEWLRAWNARRPATARAGFYGLDLYSLSSSIHAVLDYLDRVDAEAAKIARQRYGCLMPWAKDPQGYGRMAVTRGYKACEEGVVRMLRDMLDKQIAYGKHDGDDLIDAVGNARLVRSAESYYRAMYYGDAQSWNLRDTHMFETLASVLDAKGPDSKAVVGRTIPISATHRRPRWVQCAASSTSDSFAASSLVAKRC